MPYKDPVRNAQSIKNAIVNNYYPAILIRIKKTDFAFYDALQSASESVTVAEYLRQSAREKLIRDGHLTEQPAE